MYWWYTGEISVNDKKDKKQIMWREPSDHNKGLTPMKGEREVWKSLRLQCTSEKISSRRTTKSRLRWAVLTPTIRLTVNYT